MDGINKDEKATSVDDQPVQSGVRRVLRVLIADDHEIVRAGFAQFIADQGDMCVAAEAESGDQVIALVRQQDFDIVLLDISMPHKNGIDSLRIIRQIKPSLPILMLSGYPEEHYAINMLSAGASGYISKDAPPEELLRAIRLVARGRRYLSETGADLMWTKLNRPVDKKLHETLSEREFQIFRKLAAGERPTDISNELHLSNKTISTYRARVLEKMNLKTNADLTYYAIKNAMLD